MTRLHSAMTVHAVMMAHMHALVGRLWAEHPVQYGMLGAVCQQGALIKQAWWSVAQLIEHAMTYPPRSVSLCPRVCVRECLPSNRRAMFTACSWPQTSHRAIT